MTAKNPALSAPLIEFSVSARREIEYEEKTITAANEEEARQIYYEMIGDNLVEGDTLEIDVT